MFGFKRSAVNPAITSSDFSDGNWLVLKLVDENTQCRVQIVSDGTPLAFIKLNAEQLDNIIELMKIERAKMKKIPEPATA